MLVVRYYNYDPKNNVYIPDYVFCTSVTTCADGNVRLLACNFETKDPAGVILIKASQLISIRVKDGE